MYFIRNCIFSLSLGCHPSILHESSTSPSLQRENTFNMRLKLFIYKKKKRIHGVSVYNKAAFSEHLQIYILRSYYFFQNVCQRVRQQGILEFFVYTLARKCGLPSINSPFSAFLEIFRKHIFLMHNYNTSLYSVWYSSSRN